MSQDKIKFYEQVLELEPGSRLFFPLARLYFEEGLVQKARQTLFSGLEKDPQHFEARLLLATILIREGEHEQARQIYEDIYSLLSDYQDFWKSLTDILSARGEKDLSLAAAFFARAGSDKAITWTDILQSGLNSMTPGPEHASPPISEEPEDLSVQEDQPGPGLESPVPVTPPGTIHETRASQPEEPQHTPTSESCPEASAEINEQDITESAPEIASFHEDDPDHKVSPGESLQPDVHDRHQDHPEAVEEDSGLISEQSADELQPADTVEGAFKPDSEEQDEEFEEPEELADFDIEDEARTRSMADILLRQEEYAKAHDIYLELWRKSLPGSERKELEDMLVRTRQAMSEDEPVEGLERPSDSKDESSATEKKVDKKEAIDFLKTLADRLEAKSG